MNNICNKLLKTYNTNILDDIPSKIQDLFLKVSKANSKGNRGKTILMKLINNHYNNKKPKTELISGPKTLTVHWSEEYQKLIYIFGEIHGSENHCQLSDCGIKKCKILEIQDYLEKLFKTTDSFIDFYVEIPVFENKSYAYPNYYTNSYLGDIMNKFYECTQTSTRNKKKCDLYRSHYTEIRRSTKRSLNSIEWFIGLYREGNMSEDSIKYQLFDIGSQTSTFLSNFDTVEKTIAMFMSNYENSEHVKKEIRKSYIGDKIDMWTRQKITNYDYTDLIDYVKNSKIDIDSIPEYYRNITIAITKKLVKLQSIIVDTYTLARIFKKFNTDQLLKDQPEEPYNIIIYAGNNHSNRCRDFLTKELGFDLISTAKPTLYKKSRCLNMSGIQQPFFSKNSNIKPT